MCPGILYKARIAIVLAKFHLCILIVKPNKPKDIIESVYGHTCPYNGYAIARCYDINKCNKSEIAR